MQAQRLPPPTPRFDASGHCRSGLLLQLSSEEARALHKYISTYLDSRRSERKRYGMAGGGAKVQFFQAFGLKH